MKIPSIELRDKRKIPQIGLGLWQVRDQAEFNVSFNAAVKAGYRHFDTAQAYNNEQFLGEALKRSGLKRSEVYITTKIAVANFGHKKTLKAFEASLERLQTNYVDLLLLHFPVTLLRKSSWQALEEMKAFAQEMPAVNQVELHLFLQQPELITYCQGHNIAVEAYSPLAHAKEMNEPLIIEIAKKYKKSYAQIMLRWSAVM